jgi:hypothetical protein
MTQTVDLNKMGLAPMGEVEMQETDGGFLPLLVIYGAWGVMAACAIVAAGMNEALNEHRK